SLCVCYSSLFLSSVFLFFFFQAEDGIRDPLVTGVQTCALPISVPASVRRPSFRRRLDVGPLARVPRTRRGRGDLAREGHGRGPEIGRASCRERGENEGVCGTVQKKEDSQTEKRKIENGEHNVQA